VREVADCKVVCHEWTPADFGLASCDLHELQVASVEESAAIVRRVLEGEDGPAAHMVLANAAAALLAVGRVSNVKEGVALAGDSLASGRARQVLANLITASRAGSLA
jgi:anthranilate phosphoribosyltransferase